MQQTAEDVLKNCTNDWSLDNWLEIKRRLSDSVWIKAALLSNPNPANIYVSPAPTTFGIIYEIRKEDVDEIIDLRETVSFLDRVYKVVRVYMKKSAVVLRLQWALATGLPQEVADMQGQVADLEAEPSSHAFTDRLLLSLARSDIPPMGGGGPKPGPSPSPSPGPRDGGGGMGVRD
jgi:hypothetical protein